MNYNISINYNNVDTICDFSDHSRYLVSCPIPNLLDFEIRSLEISVHVKANKPLRPVLLQWYQDEDSDGSRPELYDFYKVDII